MTNYKAISAIIGLTALGMTALMTGHDGVLMGGCMAIIGGIAGYQVATK